ncbi:MAG: BatA and WFA domain-containing protein [Bacteroidota bacterium]
MSFLSPIFLFALATALLPVLYHLVRRVQAKKVQFSSLMFLKMTPKEVVRQRRIQHWLLMALRCCLLGLLALAFARPFVPAENIPFVSQRENRSVVLLVDNSYSMQYDNRFEEARRAVRGKLAEAAGEDEFSIIQFAAQTQQLTPLSSDIVLHENVVDNVLATGYQTTDFYQPLRLAEEVLSEARHQMRHIVLISDLQLGGWKGAFENWKLDPDISFEVVDLRAQAPSNLYVEDFNISEKRSAAGLIHRFDTRLGSTGDAASSPATVELAIDGAEVDASELPAAASRRSSFQYSAPREGVFQGQVSLPGDALPADDSRYFTFNVEGRPSLLGLGSNRRNAGHAVYYLDRAFNQGDQAIYNFNTQASGNVTRAQLRDISAVFISSGNPLEREINTLKAYVEGGGSLIVSFGEQATVAAFSRLLQALELGSV